MKIIQCKAYHVICIIELYHRLTHNEQGGQMCQGELSPFFS